MKRSAGLALLSLSLSLWLAACGGDDDPGCADDCGGSPDAGEVVEGDPDAGAAAGDWSALITADWELGAGSEKTSDLHTMVLDRDMYIGAIRPIDPIGTHHTVLAIGTLDAGNVIYASGVGTNAITFPPGVGLKLSAGQQLILQLHLFNTQENSISGTSGIEIIEIPEAEIEQEADLFLPGPFDLQIPPGDWTQTGTCTVAQATNIFAVFPHMHQLGTHFKTTLTIDGEDQVLHDGDYQFNDQAFISFEPIALGVGDKITTECTWYNDTADTVGWGESSTTEMCFSILYRYPASDSGFDFCIN